MTKYAVAKLIWIIGVLLLLLGCFENNKQSLSTETQTLSEILTDTPLTVKATPTANETPLSIVTIDSAGYPLILRISALDMQPCKAPCWQNITPGITSINEAWKTVFDDLDQDETCLTTEKPNYINCENFAIFAPAEHQPVEFITLLPTEEDSLEQIIQLFGEPSILYIGDIGIDSEEGVAISIPYIEQGVWLFFSHDDMNYSVDPSLIVKRMEYWSPGAQVSTEYLGAIGMRKMEWKGYGDYYPYE